MTQPEADQNTPLNEQTAQHFRGLFAHTPYSAAANLTWPTRDQPVTVSDLYRNLEKLGTALRSHSADHDRLLKANARMCRAIEGTGDLLKLMGVAQEPTREEEAPGA